MNHTAKVAGAGLAASLLSISVLAGPLTPPAGPVAPTHKTLTEVEPRISINAVNTPGDNDATPSLYKITQPGSYYLTGNLYGITDKTGIEIAASGVTLDLNGFELIGVIDGSGGGSINGVAARASGLSNITVVNGTVRNWAQSGVILDSFGGTGCRVEGVRAHGNPVRGIVVPGASIVAGCTVVGGANGISASTGSIVIDCTVRNTTANGFYADSACTLSNCSAHNNAGNGFFAFEGSTVTNCMAYDSGARGIHVHSGVTVAGCTVVVSVSDGIYCLSNCVIRDNNVHSAGQGGDGAGIYVSNGKTRVEGNTCTFADRGVQLNGSGNFAVKNICSGNTTDWVFAANNVFGPIVDRRAPASGAVNGFSAAGSTNSVDPNANFSF